MAFLTEAAARKAASDFRLSDPFRVTKSASRILEEAAATPQTSFDVFLSHSRLDAEIILGVQQLLKAQGLSVYVDWLVDPQMDRSNVTTETADKLRTRMRQSRSLIYVHSANSPGSKWMPWELGFFDGFRSAVAVLPIVQRTDETFKGVEYVSLYPYIDLHGASMFVQKGTSSAGVFGTSPLYTLSNWISTRRAVTV